LPPSFSLGGAVDGEGDGVEAGGARFGDDFGGASVEVDDFEGVDDGELKSLGVNEVGLEVGSKDGLEDEDEPTDTNELLAAGKEEDSTNDVKIDEDEVDEGMSGVRYGTATGVLSTT